MSRSADEARLPVSLVIVSRGRPDALRRLLSALQFQTHTSFELIVVSDQPGLGTMALADQARHQHFDEANISAARNIGLRMARGAVIAFCDDDAVPDPWWLDRLTAPFSDPNVGIAGGYVRGRNGISFQWKATGTDICGDDLPLSVAGSEVVIATPQDGFFPRAHGTNCAFRTEALRGIGGFDEGFRFFLDETDVCLRLGQAGWAAAIVPHAQVHHGFAESAHRTAARVPRSFFDVGASKTLFLAKHGGTSSASMDRLRADRRAQLLELMRDGRLEPRDVPNLMDTLESGLASQPDSQMPDTVAALDAAALRPVVTLSPDRAIPILCTPRSLELAIKAAQKIRDESGVPFVFSFSFTTLFHKRGYDERGFWMQSGGLFGRADRQQPLMRFTTLRQRVRKECADLEGVFSFGPLVVV